MRRRARNVAWCALFKHSAERAVRDLFVTPLCPRPWWAYQPWDERAIFWGDHR